MSVEKKPAEKTRPKASDNDNSVDHIVCFCNVDVSYCGLDVSGLAWVPPVEKDSCIVCLEMEEHPCPLCGQSD